MTDAPTPTVIAQVTVVAEADVIKAPVEEPEEDET